MLRFDMIKCFKSIDFMLGINDAEGKSIKE